MASTKAISDMVNCYFDEPKDFIYDDEIQELYSDLRLGSISLEQVKAALRYTSLSPDGCESCELLDVLKELDRRFFMVQDLRWEFSLLDVEKKDTLPLSTAKMLMKMVHRDLFSEARWHRLLNRRPVPNSPITFQEMEVDLCNIPFKEKEVPKPVEKVKKEPAKVEAKPATPPPPPPVEDVVEEAPMISNEEEELKDKLKQLEEEERLRREKEAEEAKEVEQVAEKATEDEAELERQIRETEDKLAKTNDPKTRRELEDRLKTLRERLAAIRERRIRYNLKAAIKKRRRPRLEKSVKDFKDERLKDHDGDLKKGERLIKLLKAKEDLTNAMASRKLVPLEQAMERVRVGGFEPELRQEMTQASLLAMRLRRLERIRAEILELKQSTVAEIRSYSKPPIQVHSVMTATFVLLGHEQKECKDWKTIQALVGKTGKMGLKRRCLGLEPSSVKPAVAKLAQKLIAKFELDEIRDVSAGAATFYCWSFSIIEEVVALEDEKIKALANPDQ